MLYYKPLFLIILLLTVLLIRLYLLCPLSTLLLSPATIYVLAFVLSLIPFQSAIQWHVDASLVISWWNAVENEACNGDVRSTIKRGCLRIVSTTDEVVQRPERHVRFILPEVAESTPPGNQPQRWPVVGTQQEVAVPLPVVPAEGGL